MKKLTLYIYFACSFYLYGQGNCLVYSENSGERKACELSYKAIEYPQGSKESQILFDKAIAVGPNYAWAHYQKSVPYLKRGLLLKGLEHLNTAVKLEPLNYLCYRAYWFWQYKNYELCIRDLEQFYSSPKAYPEFTPGGEKNMKVIFSMAYAKTKNLEKGIRTLEKYINHHSTIDELGLSDYYTLGVLYIKNKEFNKAKIALEKQLMYNENFAEAYYFLGIAYKNLLNFKEATLKFNKALSIFNDKYRFQNINAGFPVSRSDVLNEIEKLQH